jgi:type VI secretion system secreted protein Hcp
MAVDIFFDIDSIQGEAQDSKHKDTIDVLSWSWGISNTGSAQYGTGQGAGICSVQDINFTHYIDKASAALIEKCADGTHIKKAKLIVRKAGGTALEYVTMELEDLLVTHVSTGGSHGEDMLTENVTLNFAKFKFHYTPQLSTGAGGKTMDSTWDIPGKAHY